MRWILLACLAGPLSAQVAFHIVAVERRGVPPYETLDRIYRLDGGTEEGIRKGQRLAVHKPGGGRPFGHLFVTGVGGHHAEGQFVPAAGAYPMKGDLARPEELAGLPVLPAWAADPLPVPSRPAASPEAPPQEGVIFFQPQKADLSPAGQAKVQGWVAAWGTGGRWVVQVPARKALRPALQKQRGEALQGALRALGAVQVAVETVRRTGEGKFDPAWVKHWD